jgi:ganglioside-induced differentiation-associated protein 1
MIARMALNEARIIYSSHIVDIHFGNKHFAPEYVRLNPNITVPTLEGHGFVLKDSREIVLYAFGLDELSIDQQTSFWLDLHYEFPIDELTFGQAMRSNIFAWLIIPWRLRFLKRKLLNLAEFHQELAEVYLKSASKFDHRIKTFTHKSLNITVNRCTTDAFDLLDQLNIQLSHGLPHLCGDSFGPADIVWGVFLARINFLGFADELKKRHHVARYWATVQTRSSFTVSDIWIDLSLKRILLAFVSIFRPQSCPFKT